MSDFLRAALCITLLGSPLWLHLLALAYLLWRMPECRPWHEAHPTVPERCRCGERDCPACGGGLR